MGFGALLSPLIADPFLSDTNCILANGTANASSNLPHIRKSLVPHHPGNLSHYDLPMKGMVVTRVSYAFWIMALINVSAAAGNIQLGASLLRGFAGVCGTVGGGAGMVVLLRRKGAFVAKSGFRQGTSPLDVRGWILGFVRALWEQLVPPAPPRQELDQQTPLRSGVFPSCSAGEELVVRGWAGRRGFAGILSIRDG